MVRSVLHLLFVDDSILFPKTLEIETKFIRELLYKYLRISGKNISYEKSSLIFSLNTPTPCK